VQRRWGLPQQDHALERHGIRKSERPESANASASANASEGNAATRHPAVALLIDVAAGFRYMVRTPWLLGTLTFASLLIFLIVGPFEVLVPFVIKDRAAGGPDDHALILAAFGIGGAVGSAVIASLRMPRRYLTLMNLLWAFGCLPLAVFGLTDQIWVMAIAAFLVGAAFNGGVVIWGTLLQRRVPGEMLGRVSSLDFFVSLAFMPVSMAFSFAGRHVVVAVTEKLVAEGRFVELGHTLPARIDEPAREQIVGAVTAFLDAVGLADGPTHTEVRVGPGGPPCVCVPDPPASRAWFAQS